MYHLPLHSDGPVLVSIEDALVKHLASTHTMCYSLIGISPLDLNIEEQNFTHNFIVCTKLKQYFILGLNFAQRYKIGIDWDINRKLFLRHEGKQIAISLKTSDSGQ